MPYMSRWGEAIHKALVAYMPGIQVPVIAVNAIETLIKTAEDRVGQVMADEIATRVCEGLHPGKEAAGLKCLRCYNAEHNYNEELAIQAEMETLKEQGRSND